MIITTEGQTIVYAVFNSDGYECSDLIGVFESQETADEAAAKIRAAILDYYARRKAERNASFEWAGSVDVKSFVLGAYELPFLPVLEESVP